MKKGLLLVAFLFVVMSMGKVALAEDMGWTMHGFYVEPVVEANIPFSDDLSAAVYAGGKVGYQMNEYLGLEIESGWSQMDLTGEGDVTMIPLLFNARVNIFPGVYMLDPYAFGGIGVAFNDISLHGVEIDNCLAGQVGGGMEYHINEYLSAYLEVRFMFNDPSVSPNVLGNDDVSMNSFLVGGGIVWRF